MYTARNLEDLPKALWDDKCEATCRVAIDIMLVHRRLYLCHLRRQAPPTPPNVASPHLPPPGCGSGKAYQADSQSDCVCPYNNGVSSVPHQQKSGLDNGIPVGGFGRIAIGSMQWRRSKKQEFSHKANLIFRHIWETVAFEVSLGQEIQPTWHKALQPWNPIRNHIWVTGEGVIQQSPIFNTRYQGNAKEDFELGCPYNKNGYEKHVYRNAHRNKNGRVGQKSMYLLMKSFLISTDSEIDDDVDISWSIYPLPRYNLYVAYSLLSYLFLSILIIFFSPSIKNLFRQLGNT